MKNPDSYIFTSESNHDQMLSRETITRDVNRVMSSVSKSLPDQPNITSHSFRVGGFPAQVGNPVQGNVFKLEIIDRKRVQFTQRSQEIITNMFNEHTMRRYMGTLKPAAAPIAVASSSQLTSSAFLGFAIFGGLYLFQCTEGKGYGYLKERIDVGYQPEKYPIFSKNLKVGESGLTIIEN